LLPAFAEIMLATGELEEARVACRELEAIAASFESTMLAAIVAQTQGAVALADESPQEALIPVRRAWQLWQELEAPYDAARARVLVAEACRALGDADAAALELEAAAAVFRELGAAPDLARLEEVARQPDARATHGLTARELDVLRLVASGKTNREIAETLVISEHTVARHLQNIFAKLGLSSRTAATAYAFEHELM
jgi:DNA-binding CsgD family transcriptional regulator